MGGFHHVRVRQRVICIRHNIIGSHEWLTAAVVEDRHYYRNMNKQGIVLRSSAPQSH